MEQENTYFVQDRSNMQELGRLVAQDTLFTRAMGGVLAEQPPVQLLFSSPLCARTLLVRPRTQVSVDSDSPVSVVVHADLSRRSGELRKGRTSAGTLERERHNDEFFNQSGNDQLQEQAHATDDPFFHVLSPFHNTAREYTSGAPIPPSTDTRTAPG